MNSTRRQPPVWKKTATLKSTTGRIKTTSDKNNKKNKKNKKKNNNTENKRVLHCYDFENED